MYFKGKSFKGQLLAKYANQAEAESIATKIKEANWEHDGEKVYAKLDFPVSVRVLRTVMYTSKDVLIDGGWEKTALWTDADTFKLWCGADVVLTASISEGSLSVCFEEGWREYFEGVPKWDAMVAASNKKLNDSKTPTKGLGKGKTKDKTKGHSSSASAGTGH
eukprot:1508029-Pyramimonas_sp.AAC.1